MQDLKIALIQTTQYWEDKAKNFRHFEINYLQKMNPNEVDLVLLPEMFNTSFSMNVKVLAETINGESISWLMKWAEKLNCQVGASLIIEEAGKFYNRFVIVSGTEILSSYNKRHLFRMADEHLFFTAGTERVIHSIKGWKLFLQVCYDLRFPVFSRNKTINSKKEYDALIYIANWPEKRNYVWKTLLQARAMENQCYCLGLNRVGEDGNGFTYSGDSMLVSPWGKIDFQFSENTELVKILTLTYDQIEDITVRFPAFMDAD